MRKDYVDRYLLAIGEKPFYILQKGSMNEFENDLQSNVLDSFQVLLNNTNLNEIIIYTNNTAIIIPNLGLSINNNETYFYDVEYSDPSLLTILSEGCLPEYPNECILALPNENYNNENLSINTTFEIHAITSTNFINTNITSTIVGIYYFDNADNKIPWLTSPRLMFSDDSYVISSEIYTNIPKLSLKKNYLYKIQIADKLDLYNIKDNIKNLNQLEIDFYYFSLGKIPYISLKNYNLDDLDYLIVQINEQLSSLIIISFPSIYKCHWIWNDQYNFWYIDRYHISKLSWKLEYSAGGLETELSWFHIYDDSGNIVWQAQPISNPVSGFAYNYQVDFEVPRRDASTGDQFGARGSAKYEWYVDPFWVPLEPNWHSWTGQPHVHGYLPYVY